MIEEHLVTMRIEVGDTDNTSKKDLEEATTKLDASKLPDGEYEFYFYSIDEDNYNHIGYTFNVQDGKVVQDEDDLESILILIDKLDCHTRPLKVGLQLSENVNLKTCKNISENQSEMSFCLTNSFSS